VHQVVNAALAGLTLGPLPESPGLGADGTNSSADFQVANETVQKLREASSQIDSTGPLTPPDLAIVEYSAI
jgi:hypothetical protein